ncbi:MAG: ribose transport system substrate-binding protein [Thermomicrobiales bacterium]|nr:ribose transport system substrate-binding protein [Thermomicrobiales bacterium]
MKQNTRTRWIAQFAIALAMVLSFGQIAVAQDGTPAASPTAGSEGDALVRAMDPAALPADWQKPVNVGHVTNYLVHEWYQNLTKGEQARAAEYGINFTINDANLDLQASLAAVDDYVSKNVDVLNFTPVNEEASGPKITEVAASGKPIICESSPTDGCTTLVSIDDYAAGYKVGVWAGEYANTNLDGKAVILDVGLPALTTTVARSTGFIDGITSVLGDNATVAQSVDGQGLKDKAVQVASDALTAHPDVNVIFGINDDSALGGMQAYEAAGLDMANLLVVGFGCEGNACKDALMEGGPYKVSAAMFPEYQGRLIIDAGVAAFNGVELPAHLIAPSAPVTADNLADYYTRNDDGTYSPIFEAIAGISVEGEK